MPEVVLSEREQAALHTLLAAALDPADRLLTAAVLECLGRLIPADEVCVCVADATGCVVDRLALPGGACAQLDARVRMGLPRLGIVQQSLDPAGRVHLAHVGLTDRLVIGFRSGRDHVVQLGFARALRPFSSRDVAMLRMVTPAVERLVRERDTSSLPAGLTLQERRVLRLVAMGLSNPEIAERLHVEPCTVRKHLEHAFRKLGVTNRMAAVVAVAGGVGPRVGRVPDSPERELSSRSAARRLEGTRP